MMNLFQPCVKLVRKERVCTKVRRYYDEAKTPIDRLLDARPTTPALTKLLGQRNTTDPFTLSQRIEEQLKRLEVKCRHHKKAAA